MFATLGLSPLAISQVSGMPSLSVSVGATGAAPENGSSNASPAGLVLEGALEMVLLATKLIRRVSIGSRGQAPAVLSSTVRNWSVGV